MLERLNDSMGTLNVRVNKKAKSCKISRDSIYEIAHIKKGSFLYNIYEISVVITLILTPR